jgi:hypothetical protein
VGASRPRRGPLFAAALALGVFGCGGETFAPTPPPCSQAPDAPLCRDASVGAEAGQSTVDSSTGADGNPDGSSPFHTLDATEPDTAEGGAIEAAVSDASDATTETGTRDAASAEDALPEAARPDGAVCDGGGVVCSGTCVDTNTNPNNCGACGHSCSPSLGGTCVNGGCTPFQLSNSGGSELFVDPTNVYPYYTNSFGTFLTIVARADGTVGNSFSYFATFVVAQDASNFYLYETEGTSGTQICQIDKTTMKVVNTCIYPQGNASVAIGVAGTTLWWVDSAHTLWGGTTAGGTPNSLDTGAGLVLAADTAGLVWDEQGGALSLSSSATSVAAGTVVHPSGPFSSNPTMLVSDSTYAYWYNSADASLYRTARDNSGYIKLSTLQNAPSQLAVDPLYVYWTDSTAGIIWRVAISGHASAVQVGTQANVSGVAVDSRAIYWSTYDSTNSSGAIYELPQ